MTDALKFKIALLTAGITVSDLAEKIGVSRTYIYNCLNHKSDFRASEISAIANVLGLTANQTTSIFFALDVE